MKKETSALELRYLAKELQQLVGSKVSKIYQKDKDFLFDLYKSGLGKLQLRVIIPNFIFLTKYKPVYQSEPPKFCIFLRRRLANTVIKQIKQVDFERILEINFQGKENNYVMIIELFSKGNIVLCDQEYKIISPLQPQSWQARTIRGGTKYEYPPKQINLPNLKTSEFSEILQNSKMDSIVKTLASDMGLSGLYAEETCARENIDKTTNPKEVKDNGKLFKAVLSLLQKKIKANNIENEVFPFEMKSKKGEMTFHKNFNEAIDETISRAIFNSDLENIENTKQSKVEKVKKILEEQEKTINKLGKDIEENRRKGELIFERYQEVHKILEQVNNDRKKLSWEEIKEKYKEHTLIKQINQKEGLIIVDL